MKIFCSGIGGIGLSAYAALQNASGNSVSGSDAVRSALTDDLSEQGISISYTQDGTAVHQDIDLFVYSEAIPKNAPERMRAQELGIPQQSYFEALGEFSKDYTVIAVCGTHGKSSTTAMAALVLMEAGLDPTVVVGTKIPQLQNRNWRKGSSDIFLLEACEYRESFLHLYPDIILMTNVDGDHFDSFGSLEQYHNAYASFLHRLPESGVVITHMQDPQCAKVTKEAQLSTHSIVHTDAYALPQLSVPGRHMQENAQLVVALADHLHIDASLSLQSFSGTWRRMEIKGETSDGVLVIDDYAHHPKEVVATIAAARQAYPGRRIVCLFQPHMHDRTAHFYHDFLIAFDAADLVIITDVYDARPDVDMERVDTAKLVADIHAESLYGGSLSQTLPLVQQTLRHGDVLLVMGAGDITSIAQQLVGK